MNRRVFETNPSPILICLISFALGTSTQCPEEPAQAQGWVSIPPDSLGDIISDLQTSLSKYLGEEIFFDRIITAARNNDIVDHDKYVLFVQVVKNFVEAYYTVEAYIGKIGLVIVTYAKEYQ